MAKEYHIGIVTRNIIKASGITSFTKTAKESSSLQGAVYFQAETLYEGEYPEPARPCFGYASALGAGLFWVPKVGDTLLIEIDNSLDIPDPRYIASEYTNDYDIHRDFKKNYPWRLGWFTNCGHRLVWDDKEDEEQIYFEHTFGGRYNFKKDGSYELWIREITDRDEKDEEKDKYEEDWYKQFLDYTEKMFQMRYQELDAENFFDFIWDRQNQFYSHTYQPTDDVELYFKEEWHFAEEWATREYQLAAENYFKEEWSNIDELASREYQLAADNYFKELWSNADEIASREYQASANEWFKEEWDWGNKKVSYKFQYASGEFAEIEFDGSSKKITIHDHHANVMIMNADGTKITDKNANYIEMKAGGIDVVDKNSNKMEMTSSGTKITETSGAVLNLSGAKVAIGNGGNEVVAEAIAHLDTLINAPIVCMTGVGPSGPLMPSIVSQLTAIKTKLTTIKGSL